MGILKIQSLTMKVVKLYEAKMHIWHRPLQNIQSTFTKHKINLALHENSHKHLSMLCINNNKHLHMLWQLIPLSRQ